MYQTVTMMLFHSDMAIRTSTVVDKHSHSVLAIVDSSFQHLPLDTGRIEEHIAVLYHYLLFCYTCHLQYKIK